MDKLVYTAMSGAKETLRAMAANNHNLANVSTTGFRADLTAFQSQAVQGAGEPTRVFATNSSVGWDSTTGNIAYTGVDLDVAVSGEGWIAVQGSDGREAYTRAGDLRVDATGQLLNGAGHVVLGDGGPLTVPPHDSVTVGRDGSVSIVPLGQQASTISTIGRIKLVNPPEGSLERGADGLFRMKSGQDAPADAAVQLTSGSLESSNVNVAEAMTQMIELARRYELQIKSIRTAEEDAGQSSRLLQPG
jgi:flagellar basal-body rod protein FlgF